MDTRSTLDEQWPPRALERLNEGMTCVLTLVVAPAGSGKTSLIRRWAELGGWPVAWVTLRPADNRPEEVLTRVRSALRAAGLLPVSCEPNPVGGFSLANGIGDLINSLVGSAGDFALVLDDYQVVVSSTIHRGVRLLLDCVPPQMHVVIASRREPPLQLPRLRARRQLAEVGPQDLAEWRHSRPSLEVVTMEVEGGDRE